jgi:hypothetical protein
MKNPIGFEKKKVRKHPRMKQKNNKLKKGDKNQVNLDEPFKPRLIS